MNSSQRFVDDRQLAALPTEGLDKTDKALLRLWLSGTHLTRNEAAGALGWWSRSRTGGQTFVDFLIAHQVLMRSAGVALEQIAAGVPLGGGVSLFTVHGRDLLLAQVIGEGEVSTPSPGSSPTPAKFPTRQTRLGRRSGEISHSTMIRGPVSAGRPGRPTPTRWPSVGTELGRCLLTEPVGESDGGFVYRALHRTLNQSVVVKLFPEAEFHRDPAAARAAIDSARQLAGLTHPHLQRIWELDTCAGFTYLVVEQIEGLSLAELIAQAGRLQTEPAMKLIAQTAEGLAAAAGVDIIHGDLRPTNVLLTRDGIAKVAGLGLGSLRDARPRPADDADRPDPDVEALLYAAPERHRSGVHFPDQRGDIYSLGVCFYQAVVGDVPFRGRNRMELVTLHLRREAVPPHHVRPGIDPSVSAVILKMLTKRPEERYASFSELGEALIGLEGEILGRTEQVRTPPKGRANAQRDAWQMLLNRYGNRT